MSGARGISVKLPAQHLSGPGLTPEESDYRHDAFTSNGFDGLLHRFSAADFDGVLCAFVVSPRSVSES